MSARHSDGAAARLLRQLAALFARMAPDAAWTLLEAREREWSSLTFSGARHSFVVSFTLAGEAAPIPLELAALFAELPDHEFAQPRMIVADCSVTSGTRRRDIAGSWQLPMTIELLTVADE